jgi:peptide-methionine (S)-S-oxide reductase
MKLVTLILLSLFTIYVYASEQDATTSKLEKNERAIFAGGCFWCMEPPFDKLDGVISTTSGYTAGDKKNPTYKEVSAGSTGHTEAIEIKYNPEKITYSELLKVFWNNIDPVAVDRQFCDAGSQYRSGIYYLNDSQQADAMRSLQEITDNKPFEGKIATEILPASTFYPAEDYHQDYYQKNPLRYKYYRFACGRDQRLQELWDSKK